MQDIQTQLKNMIVELMIPETKDFIEELETLVKNNTATQDDKEAIEEMNSFLEELESIVSAVDEKLINDDEAQEILSKIEAMIEESNEH